MLTGFGYTEVDFIVGGMGGICGLRF